MAIISESNQQLNLYNFDKPEAQHSRYVLTSPRSLEACSRLRIKPLTLLPRTIQSFQKEHSGKSIELVQLLYDQWDRKRLKSLERCRKAREVLLKQSYLNKASIYKSTSSESNTISRSIKPLQQSKKKKSDPEVFKKEDNQSDNNTTKHLPANKLKTKKGLTKGFHKKIEKNVVFAVTPQPSTVTPRKSKAFTQPSTPARLKIPSVSTPNMQTDKKLVELLQTRMERDLEQEEKKLSEWMKWSQLKKAEDEQKRVMAMSLGKSLAKSREQWEVRLRGMEKRRLAEEKQHEQQLLDHIQTQDEHHLKLVEHQRHIKYSDIEQRKREMQRKKYRQSKSLECIKKEMTDFQKQTESHLKRRMNKAEKLRMEAEYKELEQIKSMNKRERERFEQIHNQLVRQRQLDEEEKLKSIKDKLNKAEVIRFNTLANKEQLHNTPVAIERIRRIESTLKNRSRIDEESQSYFMQVKDQKDEQLRKAEEIARSNHMLKANRALEKRIMNEEKRKQNIHKINNYHNNIIKKTQEDIEWKERRMEEQAQIREARQAIMRKHAHNNQVARDMIKRKFTNFSNMAHQAALANSVGRGPRTGLVNKSNIGLMS